MRNFFNLSCPWLKWDITDKVCVRTGKILQWIWLRVSTILRQYKYNKNGLFFIFWWVLITKVPNMFTSQWEIWFPWGPNQPHLLFCRPWSMYHLHFGRTRKWLNTDTLASVTVVYTVSPPSPPPSNNRAQEGAPGMCSFPPTFRLYYLWCSLKLEHSTWWWW